MDISQCSSSFSLELSIIRAKNLEPKLKGHFFVRFYISSGNNKRIQLCTKEIQILSSKNDPFWDESFSLECNGALHSITGLKQGSIVFELRWRPYTTLGRLYCGSRLLGTTVLSWERVFEAKNMEIGTWVPLNLVGGKEGKSPTLLVAAKVAETVERRRPRRVVEEGCGCRDDSGVCGDCEVLLLAAAMEAF